MSVARAARVLGLHGVRSGLARSGASASPAGGHAISHGTRRWYTTRTTVPHAFLGHIRRITTSACTANARRERVTAVPAACDSQLHDERCSSKKPVPASRATGTPAGSVTKTSLHPQWSISTSRRLRVPARRLAVHAALEPFGLSKSNLEKCTATERRCALFMVQSAVHEATECNVYRKSDGARVNREVKALSRF